MKTLKFNNPKQAQKVFEVVSEFCDASLTIQNGENIVMIEAPLYLQPHTTWLHCFKGVGVSYCEDIVGVRTKKGTKVFYIVEGECLSSQKGMPSKGVLPK